MLNKKIKLCQNHNLKINKISYVHRYCRDIKGIGRGSPRFSKIDIIF